MSRKGKAVLALMGLFAVAGLMIGCGDFFVSEGSLASITVTPSTAVLSSASSAGALTLSASGVLVDGSSSMVSPTWKSSDTSCVAISLSASGCSYTASGSSITVTPTPGGVGTPTVTASGGQNPSVPIDVIAGTVSTLAIALTGVDVPGGSLQATATINGQSLGATYVSWSVTASVLSTDASINTNGTVAISSAATVGETITVTGTITTNDNQSQSPTAQSTVL